MKRTDTFMYVVGTRPNFVKTAPVISAMKARAQDARHILVHTGQHYDDAMSSVFFRELDLSPPDYDLGVGSGTATYQTATALKRVTEAIDRERPDKVIVAGDVNSTLAAGLAAAQTGVPVAHIESGLRSFDRTMPEELNRVLTDHLSTVLFTHSKDADENLAAEGIDQRRVFFVGNTMIDTLHSLRGQIASARAAENLGLMGPYILVTLHRPALVDGALLKPTVHALEALADLFSVVFPAHPRTRAAMARAGLDAPRVTLLPPVGYLDFLSLQQGASAVLTDSGGVQEESTFLGVPCFTLRDNTERPVTIREGTNRLIGLQPDRVADIPAELVEPRTRPTIPEKWDGRAGDRAADVLLGPEPGRSTGGPPRSRTCGSAPRGDTA